jgi:hypothetical protein
MSDLKHTCAGCGQHIGYEAAHAGLEIECPNCGVSMRLPEAAVDGPGRKPFVPKPGREAKGFVGDQSIRRMTPKPPSPRSVAGPYFK